MKLYPHQDNAVQIAWPILAQYRLVYLVMEVRTGKTLTALTVAERYQAQKVLFITKKKAIPSIQADYDKMQAAFQLDVVNYESVHKYASDYDLFIIDEAHACGAYPKPSARTKALKTLIDGRPCILLSGTPTPESYSQLYHQLWLTGNSPFEEANFYKWANAGYVNKWQRMINGHPVNDYSKAVIAKIKKETDHLIVSCSQEDAGFSNQVEEVIVDVQANDIAKYLYNTIERDNVVVYNERSFIADTPANMLNKLSQIAGGTLIDDKGQALTFDDSKAVFIRTHYADKRIAIFYRYKAELQLLQDFFPKHTTDWTVFENDNRVSVFLSQIQSGREGISLRSADLIIMYNIDFSATSYWQVRARMQHKDRKTPCPIHWLFSDMGIEAHVYSAVAKKKNFTLRYYNNVRKANSKQSKKASIGSWMDSGKDNDLQHARVAGSASAQKRQDHFHRVQSTRKDSVTTTDTQARDASCSWL